MTIVQPNSNRSRLSRFLRKLLLLQVSYLCFLNINTNATETYNNRIEYKQALYALETGQLSSYRKIRKRIDDDYALVPYLDYQYKLRNLSSVNRSEALALRNQWKELPIGERFFTRWLRFQVRNGRWEEALSHGREKLSTKESCLFLHALYQNGDKNEALDMVAPLWIVGKSQDKACDPIFAKWITSGRLTEEIAWQRLQLALDNNSSVLARYLLRFFNEHRKEAESYLNAHYRPANVLKPKQFSDNRWGREALSNGLLRYGKSHPEETKRIWDAYLNIFSFSDKEKNIVEGELAVLLAKSGEIPLEVNESFSPSTIELIANETIATLDPKTMIVWIESLPKDYQAKAKWRYWLGRGLTNTGDKRGIDILKELAKERTYYGFLAAHDLGIEPSLNESLPGTEPLRVSALAAVMRLTELYAVEDFTNGRREWLHLDEKLALADKAALIEYLSQIGWLDLAIIAANRAELTDLLQVRFPTPYLETFRRHAFQTSIPVNFLIAVARQESAFNSTAVSSANALGLMQLLLPTAQQTANRIRFRKPTRSHLFDPRINIKLGSHHLAGLMRQFGDNRVLAAAAYNAGARRVTNWQKKSRGLPTVAWIETIPFKETRNYVKNVIAFSYVYSARLGIHQPVWSVHERYIP